MLEQNGEPRPPGFILAKWISIVAVCMTPLQFVVAAIMQNVDVLKFAVASVIAVPFMTLSGYWMGLYVYDGFRKGITDEPAIAPSHWPWLFRFLHQSHHQGQQSQLKLALIFLNIFAVLWSSFLLFFALGVIVLGFRGELKA